MIKSLAYMGVSSPKWKEWETFGPEVLGLEVVGESTDAVRLRIDEVAHRLVIRPGQRDHIDYIGWLVQDQAAAAVVAERVKAEGIAVEAATAEELLDRKVEGFLWFRDPTGFRHELCWGQVYCTRQFRPGRPVSGFRTGDQGLGHVVLGVRDLEEGDRFYREVMGFAPSDIVRDGPLVAYFYHVNGRHHSLAISALPDRKACFLHLMVEVNALEDVGHALDICHQREIPITTTFGQHSNDRMVSFYMYTPSCFRLEYGWGGLEVEQDLWIPRTYDKPSIWGHKRQRQDLTALMMFD